MYILNAKLKNINAVIYENRMPNGAVCLFSLKNPSYPEWTCTTNSPVMTVDFNKNYPNILALGRED